MNAWDDLPNAAHIDWVLADVARRPEVWAAAREAARDAAWDAARDAARAAAWAAAWGAAWAAARSAAWDAARLYCEEWRDEMMKIFDQLFAKPNHVQVAETDLEEARRLYLKEQAASEYHAAMAEYYAGVVERLVQYAAAHKDAP